MSLPSTRYFISGIVLDPTETARTNHETRSAKFAFTRDQTRKAKNKKTKKRDERWISKGKGGVFSRPNYSRLSFSVQLQNPNLRFAQVFYPFCGPHALDTQKQISQLSCRTFSIFPLISTLISRYERHRFTPSSLKLHCGLLSSCLPLLRKLSATSKIIDSFSLILVIFCSMRGQKKQFDPQNIQGKSSQKRKELPMRQESAPIAFIKVAEERSSFHLQRKYVPTIGSDRVPSLTHLRCDARSTSCMQQQQQQQQPSSRHRAANQTRKELITTSANGARTTTPYTAEQKASSRCGRASTIATHTKKEAER